MLTIQLWAFFSHVFTIGLAYRVEYYFLFVFGEAWRRELRAENIFNSRRTRGVISKVFSFEHIVKNKL